MGLKKNLTHGTKSTGTGCLILFSLPFAAVGVFMAYMILSTLSEWQDMKSWEQVPAEIVSAELKENSDSDGGSTYQTVAKFRYNYGGNSYTSERVSLSVGSDNIGSFHQDVYNEISKHQGRGPSFRCFVNPREPAQAILYRDLRIGMILLFLVFGIVFGSVGFGLLGFGLASSKSNKTQASAAAQYPEQPWMHRDDWRERKVKSQVGGTAVIASIIALFVSGISFPVLFIIPEEVIQKKNYVGLIALIFPLLAIALVYWAIRSILVYRKFGRTYFDLQTLPAYLGESLRGTIHTPVSVRTDNVSGSGVDVGLKCDLTVTTRSGNKTSTSTSTIWETEVKATPQEGSMSGGSTIPVDIPIPEDKFPTGDQDSSSSVSWVLTAKADIPGVDFWASFEVPVFDKPKR